MANSSAYYSLFLTHVYSVSKTYFVFKYPYFVFVHATTIFIVKDIPKYPAYTHLAGPGMVDI